MPHELPDRLAGYIKRSTVALAISDTAGDLPLIVVNDAFCKLTGYARSEVEGRNCRFLQGEETETEHVEALHDFCHDPSVEDGRFPILNYRKDGTNFRNLVFMTRLRDGSGDARFILASQFDMTSVHARIMRQSLKENDAALTNDLSEMRSIGKQFGLAMEDSARMISESVTVMARLNLDE